MLTTPTKEQLDKLFNSDVFKDRIIVLNIRSSNKIANQFDDVTHVVFNKKILASVQSTCDPGLDNLLKPVNADGCAIVMNGYWKGMWTLGYHKGKYEALVQNRPVIVFRDNDKNGVLNYADVFRNNPIVPELTPVKKKGTFKLNGVVYNIEYGMFGINCHRASAVKILNNVGLYSAGCCVVQSTADFSVFLAFVKGLVKTTGNKEVDAYYVTEDYLKTL